MIAIAIPVKLAIKKGCSGRNACQLKLHYQRLSRSKTAAFLCGLACRSAGLSTAAAAGPSSRRSRGTFGFDVVPTNRSGIGLPWPAPNSPRFPAWRSGPTSRLSAADSPFSSRGAQASTIVPFLTAGTEASEQAGAAPGQAIRSAERNESARRARRTRAKGGAAQDVPSPAVRQAEE